MILDFNSNEGFWLYTRTAKGVKINKIVYWIQYGGRLGFQIIPLFFFLKL
jgi:hypothetical protein